MQRRRRDTVGESSQSIHSPGAEIPSRMISTLGVGFHMSRSGCTGRCGKFTASYRQGCFPYLSSSYSVFADVSFHLSLSILY